MKVTKNTVLVDIGNHVEKVAFDGLLSNVHAAISRVVWPVGASGFNINPENKGNGVKPIKDLCMQYLEKNGWKLEHRLKLSGALNPGPLDATMQLTDGRFFAVEWETGNISSSHRALNKMALGILNGVLAGGILILPSRSLYPYLTDRIGNYKELEPYFPVWNSICIQHGYLGVIEIEYDHIDVNSPLIPKGTDGWLLFGQG